MQKVKVAGTFRESFPSAKVAGVWKEIDVGWVRVAGVWKIFKRPYVAKGFSVTLATSSFTGGDQQIYERRSFVRSGEGPAVGTPGPVQQGSISAPTVVIDGVTYQIRGIETGSDNVAGAGTAWKWVSIQFFGNVDPQKMARLAFLGGKRLTYIGNGGGYNAAADHTYLTYIMDSAFTFTSGTPLALQF